MEEIIQIHARIPVVKNCKPGCTDCCGPVPFTPAEWNRLPRKFRRMKPTKNNIECRFKGQDGCMVYDYRPTMCRLFGAADVKILRCPHGAAAEEPLSPAEAGQIVRDGGFSPFIS